MVLSENCVDFLSFFQFCLGRDTIWGVLESLESWPVWVFQFCLCRDTIWGVLENLDSWPVETPSEESWKVESLESWPVETPSIKESWKVWKVRKVDQSEFSFFGASHYLRSQSEEYYEVIQQLSLIDFEKLWYGSKKYKCL